MIIFAQHISKRSFWPRTKVTQQNGRAKSQQSPIQQPTDNSISVYPVMSFPGVSSKAGSVNKQRVSKLTKRQKRSIPVLMIQSTMIRLLKTHKVTRYVRKALYMSSASLSSDSGGSSNVANALLTVAWKRLSISTCGRSISSMNRDFSSLFVCASGRLLLLSTTFVPIETSCQLQNE